MAVPASAKWIVIVAIFAIVVRAGSGERHGKSDNASLSKSTPKLSLKATEALNRVEKQLRDIDKLFTLRKYMKADQDNQISDENMACIDSLDDIIDSTLKSQFWALKILDSSGKVPTGLLNGNIIILGDYDQCVSVSSGVFQGQYCLLSLVIEVPPEIIYTFTGSSAEDIFGTNIEIKLAICVPSTCKAKAIEHAFNNGLDHVNPWLNSSGVPIALRVTLPDTNCHVRTPIKFNTMDWVVLILIAVFSTGIILSTIFDLWLRSYRGPCYSTLNKGPRAVLAFSAYSNAQRLFSTKAQPDAISCINGLRFISIAWVCLGHRIKYTAQLPATNLVVLLDYIKNWPTMVVVNATLAVDTFFVISGLLNAYIFLGLGNKPMSLASLWLTCMIKRILRLTPAFAAMMAFTATLMYKLGDGPLWDQLAGQEKEACEENWWINLLYFNNYYRTEKLCMMQSWYLSVDTQLFALSIFLLYILKRWRILGLALLSILMIISLIIPFVISYLEKIRAPIPLTRNEDRVDKEMALGYFPTHMRASSYLVGIAAGYILQRVKAGVWSEQAVTVFTLRRPFIWVFMIALMMSSLLGCYWMFQPEVPYLWFYSSFYIAVHRFMWAVGIAWIIIDSTFNKDGIVNRCLSCQFFMPLGRLTYCIYLTHVVVIIYKLGTARQPNYITPYDQLHETIGDLVISIFFATILSLLFESPIMVLEKTLLHDSGKSKHDNNGGSSFGSKHEISSTMHDSASDMDSDSIEKKTSDKSNLTFRSSKSSNDKLKTNKSNWEKSFDDDVDSIKNRIKTGGQTDQMVFDSDEGRAEYKSVHQDTLLKSYLKDYRQQFPKVPPLRQPTESEICYALNPYTKIDYERISMPRTPPEVILSPWQNWMAACPIFENDDACSSAQQVHHRIGHRLQRESQENDTDLPHTDRISNSVLSTCYGVNNPIYHYASSNFDET